MDTFTVRDLREHTGALIHDAEEGELSLITKHGKPVFLAVPFTRELLDFGLRTALAIKLFKDETVTLEKAAKLAGLTTEAFIVKLGKLGVPVVKYSAEELDQELKDLAKKIIADAGPLIAFGRIKRLSLIANTLGFINISAAVRHECIGNTAQLGAHEILEAINGNIITIHEDPDMEQHQDLLEILGEGEATSIVLASQLNAGLLIDEKLGRKTAQKFNLQIIGTAGVMLLAKEQKIIEKIKPIIQELKKTSYYLSDELVKKVLLLARE